MATDSGAYGCFAVPLLCMRYDISWIGRRKICTYPRANIITFQRWNFFTGLGGVFIVEIRINEALALQ
jgi:hypothetical protein